MNVLKTQKELVQELRELNPALSLRETDHVVADEEILEDIQELDEEPGQQVDARHSKKDRERHIDPAAAYYQQQHTT